MPSSNILGERKMNVGVVKRIGLVTLKQLFGLRCSSSLVLAPRDVV